MANTTISGQLVDIRKRSIRPVTVHVREGCIADITPNPSAPQRFILPGFIDAHVHIESSMLTPSSFAKLAVRHGTVATVSDPHEIANVLGVSGVYYMIADGERVGFKFFFGAPSCVPATNFETAGNSISSVDIHALMADPRILYLSEMMNWPGVLQRDPEVMEKIAAAKAVGKPVDGHAPGLFGARAAAYAAAGISTDHESFSLAEARDKLNAGMKIIIREGSAAKNFAALFPLIEEAPGKILFCSDDKHPDDLLRGHINQLVERAVGQGVDVFAVLHAACLAPIEHYQLPVGALELGDPADCIVVDSLETFGVQATYIDGICVYEEGKVHIHSPPASVVNSFCCSPISAEALSVPATGNMLRVIEIVPGELVSKERHVSASVSSGVVVSNTTNDVLKLVVYNRYCEAAPAVAFVSGFGLSSGALASSVAHDSHNIIAVGVDDRDIVAAINEVVRCKGGVALANGSSVQILPLPVAGLMSTDSGEDVAYAYERLDAAAKALGSKLPAPFMSLSFLALLVIPQLKLSDKGLFDGERFNFVSLFVDA